MFTRKQTDEATQGKTTMTETRPKPAALEPPRAAAPRPEPVPPRRTMDGPAHPPRQAGAGDSKKLIVGPDISLHGHIASCDRLVVEGTVEAELKDCHTVEITETGIFIGAAEIESADVSGRYEGSLTVRGHLLVRGSGSVSGTVRYGRLEIQPGGVVNGDIRHAAPPPAAPLSANLVEVTTIERPVAVSAGGAE
jgi:cytoskeletal protein CcmA (bactofilin family)